MTLEVPGPGREVESSEVVRARANRRMWTVGVVLLTLLTGVGVRGVQLCVMPAENTIAAASVQRWRNVKHAARRGAIFDRHGRRLAVSVQTPNIVIDPTRVPEEERLELATVVAEILELDRDEVAEKMARQSQYARLASRVHPSIASRIDELRHKGVWSERGARRYYPEERLAAQVLGFVDASGRGQAGLERHLDDRLRGGSMLLQRRRDRRGRFVESAHRRDDVIGKDVYTTLDRSIQRMAERALEGVVERSDPVAASIVVMDVRSGDVLAMANAPTFNPNRVGADATPLRNHAVQDALEPGSVMKPFTIAAAIEEGLVTTATPIDCEGGVYKIGRVRIHDDHPHRVVSVSEVLKFSSNIGSAKLALQLGAKRLTGYFERFGFSRRSGIRLPGERAGVIRKADRIKPIELATTSYGQGMTATPLQVASATAALANGGLRMRPRLVKRIEDTHGVPEVIQTPVADGRVVSRETAESIARALVTVTENGGTATKARVPGYRVAAKTGTAEKVVEGRYSSTARVSSMMGFLPADAPEIAIVVMVDEPRKGSRYGGTVAGPAFAEVASEAIRYLGIPPDPALLEPVEVEADDAVADLDTGVVRVPWSGARWTVPDLGGRTMREVTRAMQGTGLGLELQGSGVVVAQTPPAGSHLAPGEKVSLTFE